MTTDADMSSWTDLLYSSLKLVEQAAPSAQFPPLQRNLDQLEALSKKLKSKTLRTEALFQSIAATRLLAREGINAEQLARDLKSFELKTTFEDVFPAEATSVEEYLQQVREMAMVSAVQEAQKDNLRNFSDYMMTVLEDDWQKEKGDFLHSLSRISTLPRTKNQPGKDTLSPRSKRLKPAHPKKKEIRAFQKLKRKRIKHQSEASFMASILSDIAKGEGDEEEEEEIEKEEEKVEGEEEKGKEEEEGKEEEKDESSEDETIFPLNQTVTEPQPPPKFTSKSGKISIEIASDDSTSPKTTHPSPPYHSPKSATEGPISRTEFQNLASVVQALDSKSEAILKAVQGLAASVPSLAEREKHLDQLISARQKHSMEESEARWTKSTKDFLELIESITTLQNDTVDQFNNLHNNNARQHRRELKFLLNQLRERDNCNLVIQAVLVKALSSIQHLIDIPNFKFDEVLKLMESLLSTIRDQAPTADAYNLLHSTMSTHFTSLNQHISDLRGEVNFGSSSAEPKGGEDDIEDEEKREDDQSPFDPMVTAADGSVKPWSQIAEEEQQRLKLSWSQWPKTLSDSFAEARIQAIAHRENLISEFQNTIPIHIESDPIIEDIDNPNLDQHDGISESEESSGPNLQFFIIPEAVKVMQSAAKGKKTALDDPVKTDNMSEDDDDDDDMTEEEKMLKEALKRSLVEQKGAAGTSGTSNIPTHDSWDQDQIKEALSRSLVDQGPLRPAYGPISPWNHQATISDSDLKPHKTFELPTNHQTHIDLPLSPNAHYYSRFPPSLPHLPLVQQIIPERRLLKDFYMTHSKPPSDVWSLSRILKFSNLRIRSFTRRPSKTQKFYAFDIIRADKTEQQISEADFPNLNPSDILTIARHFEEQRFRTHTATIPYLAASYFLRDYVVEIGRFDFELFEIFWKTPPNAPDLTLPSIEGRIMGPTDNPELGFIFHLKGKDQLGFFRLSQKHKFDSKFLQKIAQKTLKKEDTASAETRSRIYNEITWWIAVRNWILGAWDFTNAIGKKK